MRDAELISVLVHVILFISGVVFLSNVPWRFGNRQFDTRIAQALAPQIADVAINDQAIDFS